jgi:adenosylcobinamide-GDP ribazoletransferase
MRSFFVAVAFLTVIPIRFRSMPTTADVARSRFWYPVAGLLLGAILGGWTFLVSHFASPLIGGFLVLIAWVGLTGALHLDGFADLCDGLFGGKTPEERLKIMKDPHVGTFGVIGVVLLLLGKFTMVSDLMARQVDAAPWLVAGAVLAGRCVIWIMSYRARYPRPDGTGKVLVEATDLMSLEVNLGFAGAALAFICLNSSFGLAVASGATVIAIQLLGMTCERRLGGVTGDCLGAGIELAELCMLTVAAIWPYAAPAIGLA